MTTTADGTIAVEDADGVRTLRIERAARRNALTAAMYEALADALGGLGEGTGTRVALLLGDGATFCAGNDLADFESVGRDGAPTLDAASPQGRLLHALAACELPIVAAVDGAAVGIGFTALLHADIVVATPAASFSAPFVPLGVCPEAGSSLLLPPLAGRQRAMEVFLLGRRLGAEEALAAGLVNRLVEPAALEETAREYARALAALPVHAVRHTKRLVAAPPEPLGARIDRELGAFGECLADAATQAAIAAARARTSAPKG